MDLIRGYNWANRIRFHLPSVRSPFVSRLCMKLDNDRPDWVPLREVMVADTLFQNLKVRIGDGCYRTRPSDSDRGVRIGNYEIAGVRFIPYGKGNP